MDLRDSDNEIRNDRLYLLAGIFCLLFVMTRYFSPFFVDNELAYTMGPIKFAHPDFLIKNPYINGITSTFFTYNLIASPLYKVMNYLQATLVCRLVIWVFQLWALLRLLKCIGVKWWGACLLIVLWLDNSQNLGAGEWVIECATGKPIAYGFIFLALENAIKKKLNWAGVCAGAAVSFHVAVGIWSCLALSCAILVTHYRQLRLKEVSTFLFYAVLLSLPGTYSVLSGVLLNSSAATVHAEIARISVLIANPFHLDPHYFSSGLKYFRLVLYLLFTVTLFKYLLKREQAGLLTVFLVALFGIYNVGIVAREFDWYGFLQYYPFRVLDGFLPLAFWMAAVLLIQKAYCNFTRYSLTLFLFVPVLIGLSNYVTDRFRPTPHYGMTFNSFIDCMMKTEPRLTAYYLKAQKDDWSKYLSSRDSIGPAFYETADLIDMHNWVKTNTPVEGVFIVPLRDYRFSLRTERTAFVSWLYVPVDKKILDWKERMEAINQGKMRNVGFGIEPEVSANYRKLTEKDLNEIKRKFGADYILTSSEAHLNYELLHQNASYRLYRL